MALLLPRDPNSPAAVLAEGKITTKGWNIIRDNLYSFYADAITKSLRMITQMRLRNTTPSQFWYSVNAGTTGRTLTRRNYADSSAQVVGTIDVLQNTFFIYDNRIYLLQLNAGVQEIHSYALDLTDEQLVGSFDNTSVHSNRLHRDATHFYSLPGNSSNLQRYTLTGMPDYNAENVVEFSEYVYSISIFGQHMYWLVQPFFVEGVASPSSRIIRTNLDGTGQTELFDTNNVIYADMTTDGTYFYFNSFASGNIIRVDFDGSNEITLINNTDGNIDKISNDGTYLYGVLSRQGPFRRNIIRYDLDGSNSTNLFDFNSPGNFFDYDLTVDGTYLYSAVSIFPNIVLTRYDLDGSNPTILNGNSDHVSIESDGTNFYSVDLGTFGSPGRVSTIFKYLITPEARTQIADLEINQNDYTVVIGDYVFVYGFDPDNLDTKGIYRFNKSDGTGKLTIRILSGISHMFTDGTHILYTRNGTIYQYNVDGTGEIEIGDNGQHYTATAQGLLTNNETSDKLLNGEAALWWPNDFPPGVTHTTDHIVKMRIELEGHIPFNLDMAWSATLVTEPHSVSGGIRFEIFTSDDAVSWVQELQDDSSPTLHVNSNDITVNINPNKRRYVEFRWTEKQGIYFRTLSIPRFHIFPAQFDVQSDKVTFQNS